MPLIFDKLYPAVPYVERGKPVIIGAHPKGGFIVYPNKKNVIIRDLSPTMDNDVYSGHPNDVQCAKYSPSGFYVASGDKSGNLHIWDTTQKEHLLKKDFQALASVNDVAWSFDNRLIAVGGVGCERFGKVYNVEIGNQAGSFYGMSKPINSLDFKPTRPLRLITANEDFTACLFDSSPYTLLKTLKHHTNFVQCCKFSPKGDIFVTGGSDGKLFAYDVTSGDLICEVGSPAHKGSVYGLNFSPSGSRIVSVSADKKIKLWSAEKPYDFLDEYAFEDKLDNMQLGCVWTVGKIVSQSLSGALIHFDVTDDCSKLGAPAGVMFGHSRPIRCACYSTASDQLITASYDGLMVRWSLPKGLAEPFEGKEGPKSAIQGAITCDDRVVSIAFDDRVVFSSLSNRAYEQSVKVSSQPRAICLATSKNLFTVICLNHLYIFSLAVEATTSLLVTLDITPEATTGCITAKGDLVVVGKADGRMELFQVSADGKCLKAMSEMPEEVPKVSSECTCMFFSPDDTYLAVGDANRYINLFKVEGAAEGRPKLTLCWSSRDHAARVTCVAWSPNGQHFATGSLDCSIMVFSPTTSSRVCEVRNAHPASMITALMWKSNNEIISTGFDACVRTWKFE